MAAKLVWIAVPLVMTGLIATAQPPDRKGPKPPSKEDAAANAQPPRIKGAGKNLLVNGDFEEGDTSPAGWQTIDGLCTFWVKDSDPAHGKVLKFDTDIQQSQAYAGWLKIVQGKAVDKDAHRKLPTAEPTYD